MSRKKLTQLRRRVKWAGIGAAIGAGVGAVVNTRLAGVGGAFGGTTGAVVANLSVNVEDRADSARSRLTRTSDDADA